MITKIFINYAGRPVKNDSRHFIGGKKELWTTLVLLGLNARSTVSMKFDATEVKWLLVVWRILSIRDQVPHRYFEAYYRGADILRLVRDGHSTGKLCVLE